MRQVMSIVVVTVLLAAGFSAARVTAQEPLLRELLPAAADIGPGYVAVDDRARTLGEQAAMFGNPDEAGRLLATWGWRDNAFVVFQAVDPTAGGAPVTTVDISLTRFAAAADAAAALAYFLDDRAAVLGQGEAQNLSQWTGGDELRAIAGPVPGGDDTTLYARSGPLLLRVSATAAPGQTAPNPEEIARGIIARFTGQPGGASVTHPAAETGFPSLASFQTLPLDNAACFRVAGEGDMDLPAVAERLATGEDVAGSLDDLGWAGGSYRQFACDAEPGHAGWIDLSVHRFSDAASAAAAVSLFAETRARGMDLDLLPVPLTTLGDGDAALAGPAVNGTEYTRYVSRGAVLFAVTGVAPAGDPRPDVEQIVVALLAQPLDDPAPLAVTATATPYQLGEAAPPVTAMPTATPMPPKPIPEAPPMPLPTATPFPTATAIPPTPVPTATPLPTVPPPTPTPEAPSLIVVTVPPQPAATTGPLPTATPRVINLPDAG